MNDPLVRTVLTLMNRYGGPAKLIAEVGEATYDYETSTSTPNIKTFPIRVIAFDYIQRMSGMTVKDGTMVRTGDKQLYILPSSTVPAPTELSDKIEFQGNIWTVIAVKSHNPSGNKPYLYEVYVRL